MNAKQQKAFLNAMKEMVEEKGISESVIVDAISDAFKVAYNKKLSDELLIVKKPSKLKTVKKIKDKDGNVVQTETTKLSDALIRCDIDLKKGKIETYRQWKVVNDDDLTDDFVEISVNDDKVKAQNLKVGDFYEEPLSFDDFSKGDVNRFISAYKAKINKAEKDSLLKSFSGKIHELINGTVEKSDGRSVLVNIGKISITLYNKDLIGHETFKPGDNIRMYVCGIANDESKGESLIKCSRSVPEFIGKIFTDEVHEVYDGTVKIYKIARMAGIRSKVAVYSEDPNVDAQGACIGPNGTRVQNIVNSLGNGKEKIDVVQYYPVLGMFLRECLKPGVVIGKGGAEIEKVKAEVQKLTDKKLVVDIKEVKRPDKDAQLVAENIALQLENRISFRRAMKSCMSRTMKSGALGVKTSVSGRLGGADMARTEFYSEGTIPLQTLRADIDYGFAEANTTYGKVGVKVWIYKGEVLPEKTVKEGDR